MRAVFVQRVVITLYLRQTFRKIRVNSEIRDGDNNAEMMHDHWQSLNGTRCTNMEQCIDVCRKLLW